MKDIFKTDETFQRSFYEWRKDRRMTFRFINSITSISVSILSDYAQGIKDIPRKDLVKISECLEVTPNQLINP